jgi:hypothetical protein
MGATVEELARQLATERQLRGTTEQTVQTLRRDNARLIATTRCRTHYVVFIPKPKWGVMRDVLLVWFAQLRLWAWAAWVAAKEATWPEGGD